MAIKGGWKGLGVVGARQSWGSLCQATAPRAPALRQPGASAVCFIWAHGPGSCQLKMFPGRRIWALCPRALCCCIFPAKTSGKGHLWLSQPAPELHGSLPMGNSLRGTGSPDLKPQGL